LIKYLDNRFHLDILQINADMEILWMTIKYHIVYMTVNQEVFNGRTVRQYK
jgi:hypothetical protein